MTFTQKNLFFVYKGNFGQNSFGLLASTQRYANTHAAKMRIKGQQNGCHTQCSTTLKNTA